MSDLMAADGNLLTRATGGVLATDCDSGCCCGFDDSTTLCFAQYYASSAGIDPDDSGTYLVKDCNKYEWIECDGDEYFARTAGTTGPLHLRFNCSTNVWQSYLTGDYFDLDTGSATLDSCAGFSEEFDSDGFGDWLLNQIEINDDTHCEAGCL